MSAIGVYCHQCGFYHAGDEACYVLAHDPLPPTAEQTSIGQFNALADQIRALTGQLDRMHADLSGQVKGLGDGLAGEIAKLYALPCAFCQMRLADAAMLPASEPWTCIHCGQLNSGYSSDCGRCEGEKPHAKPRKAKRRKK